jgi:hypothetical protein
VHLVIDTSGSSRFWRMIRKMQRLDDAEIHKQSQLLNFDANVNAEIRTERFNVAPIMAPGELEAIANDLISDFSQHTGNNSAVVEHYTRLLSDLAKDWRETWLLYGYGQQGIPHYKKVLQTTVQQLNPEPRAIITSSNKVGVNPIIMQRIIRAAINIEELPFV